MKPDPSIVGALDNSLVIVGSMLACRLDAGKNKDDDSIRVSFGIFHRARRQGEPSQKKALPKANEGTREWKIN